MISKKKICLILMVLALGACNISFAQDTDISNEADQQDIEEVKGNKELLEKAQECMTNKDFQSAIVYLTKYIAAKPKKYEAYKLRGKCFYALRQYKLAEIDFQTAVDLKADDDKFMTGTKYIGAIVLGADKQEQLQNPELGNLYGELMYAQKAQNKPVYEASYDKAVEYNSHIYLPRPKKDDITKINCPQKYGKVFNPQGVDAEIAGTIEDIENGRFHEALYKTPSITSTYPKYYLGYYLSGVALAGMENYDDAVTSFQTALKYNPYDFESLASLGQVYYSQAEKTFSSEDSKKSVEYFNQALKYNPNCNTYYFYIGLNDLLIKDYTAAISNFNTAIKYKTNDYNSMYYKLIAQYMNGDYKSAEETATKLLYRHVSNYNSVLYMRALAKYKQGFAEDALADIEKIHNNMNDIYNADLKPLSDKEKTLVSYLYYLKSDILKSKGMGTKADLQKAFENPIIAALDARQTELILTPVQLDNQFDYIRTTFSDLSLAFQYLNPDYKLAISKLPEPVAVEPAAPEPVVVELRQSSEPEERLANDDRPSIAQLLASQSLLATKSNPPESINVPVAEPETLEQEAVVPIDNADEIPETVAEAPQPVIIEAEQKQVSQDFEIKYEDTPAIEPDQNEVLTQEDTIVVKADQPEFELVKELKNDEDLKKIVSPVVEKHADVDLTQFELPKQAPEIKETDEIIVLEPQKTIFTVPQPQETTITPLEGQYQAFEQPVEDETPPEKIAEIIPEPPLIVPELTAVPEKNIEPEPEQPAEVVSEITEPQPIDFVEAQPEQPVCEVNEAPEIIEDVPPVKEKKRKNKKEKIKKQRVKTPKLEAEAPAALTAEQSSEKETAISSIIQSVFTGDDNVVVVEDKNLEELEEVKPIEIEEPELIQPKKKKGFWHKRKKSEIPVSVEEPEVNITDTELPVKTPWYKKIFKRNKKSVEVEPETVQEPEVIEDTSVIPDFRAEKVEIDEIQPVSDIEEKPKKKWFNWFKKKPKVQETPVSQQSEKKVIKQLSK